MRILLPFILISSILTFSLSSFSLSSRTPSSDAITGQISNEEKKAVAYLISREKKDSADKEILKTVAGYYVHSRGVTLKPEQVTQLSQLIEEKASDKLKECRFNPGLAFQIYENGKEKSLLVDFDCNQHRWGKKETLKNFDSVRSKWLEFARTIFPANKKFAK